MTALTELPDGAASLYARVLRDSADALADYDVERARRALAPIAGQRWMLSLTPRRSQEKRPPDAVKRARRAVPLPVVAAMFQRDQWRCKACHGPAIPRRILAAFSDVFPEEIPYDMHYGKGRLHPAYWALVAEADHRVPHSRNGSNDLENLDSMHAMCNTLKSDANAEDPPSLTGPADVSDWDGLVAAYPAIVLAGNVHGRRHSSTNRYHRDMLRAFGYLAVEELRPDL